MRIACQEEGIAKAWDTGVPLTRLRFVVADFADTPAAAARLRTYFASAHPDTRLKIGTAVDQLERQQQTVRRIIAVLVFLTAVGLFIASINLLNLMLIRVMRSTKGIGILRARLDARADLLQVPGRVGAPHPERRAAVLQRAAAFSAALEQADATLLSFEIVVEGALAGSAEVPVRERTLADARAAAETGG